MGDRKFSIVKYTTAFNADFVVTQRLTQESESSGFIFQKDLQVVHTVYLIMNFFTVSRSLVSRKHSIISQYVRYP